MYVLIMVILEEIKEWVHGGLAASTLIIPIVVFILALKEYNPIYIYFLVFYFIVGDYFTDVLKKWFKKQLGADSILGKRPNPCGNGMKGKEGLYPVKGSLCVGCSKIPKGRKSRSYGLPSGHSHEVVFTAMFWSLYLYFQSRHTHSKKIWYISLLWILAFLVMIQRIVSGCHNRVQVQLGSSLGLLSGALAYFFYFGRL